MPKPTSAMTPANRLPDSKKAISPITNKTVPTHPATNTQNSMARKIPISQLILALHACIVSIPLANAQVCVEGSVEVVSHCV